MSRLHKRSYEWTVLWHRCQIRALSQPHADAGTKCGLVFFPYQGQQSDFCKPRSPVWSIKDSGFSVPISCRSFQCTSVESRVGFFANRRLVRVVFFDSIKLLTSIFLQSGTTKPLLGLSATYPDLSCHLDGRRGRNLRLRAFLSVDPIYEPHLWNTISNVCPIVFRRGQTFVGVCEFQILFSTFALAARVMEWVSEASLTLLTYYVV